MCSKFRPSHLAGALLFILPIFAARAVSFQWLEDSSSGYHLRVSGFGSISAFPGGANLHTWRGIVASPSGLWTVDNRGAVLSPTDYNGGVGLHLDVYFTLVDYWDTSSFVYTAFGAEMPYIFPVAGVQFIDFQINPSNIQDVSLWAGNEWTGKVNYIFSLDQSDPTLVDYTMNVYGSGPVLPSLPDGGSTALLVLSTVGLMAFLARRPRTVLA
jgi:hypothetical protein